MKWKLYPLVLILTITIVVNAFAVRNISEGYQENLPQLQLEIVNYKIRVVKDILGFQTRHKHTLQMFEYLYENYKELVPPTKSFCISSVDTSLFLDSNFRVLTYSTCQARPNAVAIPDFTFSHWPEAKLPPFDDFFINTSKSFDNFDNKIPKMLWIGAPTHDVRTHIFDLCHDDDNINIHLMDWNNPSTPYIDMYGHGSYKYLLDIKGVGWSARLKFLFLLGSVVFVVEREDNEYWWKYFTPWVHYVPIKEDGSNIKEVFYYVYNNPSLAKTIAYAGHRKAREVFDIDNVYRDFAKILTDF